MQTSIWTRKRESGFTMIELLMTMIILAALAAVAIPGFSSWLPNYRLKSAVRDLYSSMQLAKLEAIKQNQNCSVTFSSAPDQYAVSLINKTVVLANYENGIRYKGPGGETFDASPLTFNSRGLSNNLGYVYLSNDRSSSYYRVGVPSISGAVKLERWNGGAWE
jgi:prepilin-type N-terminal cleavage/methylation domain-containing protein